MQPLFTGRIPVKKQTYRFPLPWVLPKSWPVFSACRQKVAPISSHFRQPWHFKLVRRPASQVPFGTQVPFRTPADAEGWLHFHKCGNNIQTMQHRLIHIGIHLGSKVQRPSQRAIALNKLLCRSECVSANVATHSWQEKRLWGGVRPRGQEGQHPSVLSNPIDRDAAGTSFVRCTSLARAL